MATLTPKITKELHQLAQAITPPDQPPGAQPGKALTAQELKERYGITTDNNGKPLNPMRLYVAKDLPAVNHHRRLLKAFERAGWEAVEQYLQPYTTPAAIARDLKAQAQNAPPVLALAQAGVVGQEQGPCE